MQCQGRSRWQRSNQGRTTGARQAGRDGEGRRATGRRPSVLQVLSAKLHWIPLTATVSMVTARCFAVTIRPAPPPFSPSRPQERQITAWLLKITIGIKCQHKNAASQLFPKEWAALHTQLTFFHTWTWWFSPFWCENCSVIAADNKTPTSWFSLRILRRNTVSSCLQQPHPVDGKDERW